MFVNDIKIIRPKENTTIKKVKRELAIVFEIVNMGPISFYLDLKIE